MSGESVSELLLEHAQRLRERDIAILRRSFRSLEKITLGVASYMRASPITQGTAVNSDGPFARVAPLHASWPTP
jgi:hypothetical protein